MDKSIKIVDKIINPDFIIRCIRHPKASDYPSMPAVFVTHIPSATAYTHFGDMDSCIDTIQVVCKALQINTKVYLLAYASGRLFFNDYVPIEV